MDCYNRNLWFSNRYRARVCAKTGRLETSIYLEALSNAYVLHERAQGSRLWDVHGQRYLNPSRLVRGVVRDGRLPRLLFGYMYPVLRTLIYSVLLIGARLAPHCSMSTGPPKGSTLEPAWHSWQFTLRC